MKVGVLALQGDFRDHAESLEQNKLHCTEVRLPSDLEGLNALVIPGGESTAIALLAKEYRLDAAILNAYRHNNLCLWGTCAGAIYLSQSLTNHQHQQSLGLLEASIERNAFGRQNDSFETNLCIEEWDKTIPVSFIRAPAFVKTYGKSRVLASHEGRPVFVESRRIWATCFHVETEESAAYFNDRFLKWLNSCWTV